MKCQSRISDRDAFHLPEPSTQAGSPARWALTPQPPVPHAGQGEARSLQRAGGEDRCIGGQWPRPSDRNDGERRGWR
jgi:hypothetical protein